MPAFCCPFENCSQTYKFACKLQKHYKYHEKTTFACDVCQKVCKSKSALGAHYKKIHKNPKKSMELEIKHICEFCGKVAKNPHVLKNHMMYKHVDPSNYEHVCTEPNCGKRFYLKKALEEHTLRHKGIKNFACPNCEQRFVTKNDMQKHINSIHLKIRKYCCQRCPATFSNSEGLKRHFRSLHEFARDFQCQYCEKAYTKKDALRKHEMTHTGEKPHKCPECGLGFIQRVSVNGHRKIHYPDGNIPPLPVKPSRWLIVNRTLNASENNKFSENTTN